MRVRTWVTTSGEATEGGRGRYRGRDRGRDRGSVLVLVPVGFLVLVLMATLAVDSAVAYRGQSELHDALEAAANDAVAAGLNDGSFYARGSVELNPSLVAAVVCQAVQAQNLGSSLHDAQLSLAVSGDSVEVTGSAVVDAVFGRAVPGLARRSVRARADATLSSGAPPSAAPYGPATPIPCRS
jgi:Flp pilus assembly protein TadG